MRLLNIISILSNYYRSLRSDLTVFWIVVVLVFIPAIITIFFWILITDLEQLKVFINSLLLLNSVILPLLLNALVLIYMSVEKVNSSKTIANDIDVILKFHEHLHSVVTMTALLSLIILFVALIFLANIKILNTFTCLFLYYLVALEFVNMVIILRRLDLLIRLGLRTS